MTEKEQLKILIEIAKENNRLLVLIKMNEPTKKRMLEVHHNKDLDEVFSKIDEEYGKNLRLRANYDNIIDGAYMIEDEDLRFLLNGEEPYKY